MSQKKVLFLYRYANISIYLSEIHTIFPIDGSQFLSKKKNTLYFYMYDLNFI